MKIRGSVEAVYYYEDRTEIILHSGGVPRGDVVMLTAASMHVVGYCPVDFAPGDVVLMEITVVEEKKP
jgi:hypothetical protein